MSGAERHWPEDDYPHQDLTRRIIAAAIKVHSTLGPGFVESIYENALVHELTSMGLKVRQQVIVSVLYEGVKVGEHRIDVLVEDLVVVELKAVSELLPIHQSQTKLTMKAAKLQVALLINFNVPRLTEGGIKRIVNTR